LLPPPVDAAAGCNVSSEKDATLTQKQGQLELFALPSGARRMNARANLYILDQTNRFLASGYPANSTAAV
jgi:hypothetical protein